jgi:hypothetical protein
VQLLWRNRLVFGSAISPGGHLWAKGDAVSTVGFVWDQVSQYMRAQEEGDGSRERREHFYMKDTLDTPCGSTGFLTWIQRRALARRFSNVINCL